MKLISSKELAAHSSDILKQLATGGSVVITEAGQPKGLLVSTSAETVLEDVQEQVRARARRAVSAIRRDAGQGGLDRLPRTDIDQEIAAARKARRPETCTAFCTWNRIAISSAAKTTCCIRCRFPSRKPPWATPLKFRLWNSMLMDIRL